MIGRTWYDPVNHRLHCTQLAPLFLFGEPPIETYDHGYLLPTVKHEDGFVVIWATVSWHSAGSIISVNDRMTANEQLGILNVKLLLGPVYC